ncbi:hypothetical protein [Kitasatospora purpeofusca]|uniref:Uncharacterized protein n=1 Tax=Kitasatospora purpeofusca TaxID=67352 RepID=A0ABZ1UEI7_9ACTN|nr:hypothetical protein [Kitasatospora purpeofusca]
MTTENTAEDWGPRIRINLRFFEDFDTVVGLVRATGGRRTASRDFVLEGPMTLDQVAALVELQRHRRHHEASDPVTVTVEPIPDRSRFMAQQDELAQWWGTVDQPNWR